jgi:hypothetical protein
MKTLMGSALLGQLGGPVTGSGFFCWWLREPESTLIKGICGPRGQDAEHHPFRLKLFPQDAVVLDDSVLQHRHPARPIEVRVGVAFLRFAVRSPAGVTDAAAPRSTRGLKPVREVDQLALGPQAAQLPLAVYRGDAGRVIAAVFQLA